MKQSILIVFLLASVIGYSQNNHPIVFGQEMTISQRDSCTGARISLVADNQYEVYGLGTGDTLFYNNDVIVDTLGYPMDLTYEFEPLNTTSYKIVGTLED